MNRNELRELVRRNESDTLFACRMREALGLPKLQKKRVTVRDHSAKRRKYRGAKKLMQQKYGVKL